MFDSAILGQSQTFFGVLTTLVVLCTIFDSSNFLNNVLGEIRDDMKAYNEKSCYEYRANLKDRIGDVKRKISLHKDAYMQRKESDYTSVTNKILDDLELTVLSLENDITDLEKELNVLFSKSEMEEQTLTPLYAFLFCIIVFLCEEFVFLSRICEDWIVTFLFIFTILSFALCFSLWFFHNLRTKVGELLKEKEEYMEKDVSHKKNVTVLLLGTLLFLTFWGIYVFASLHFHLSESAYGASLFLSCFVGTILISCTSIKHFTAKYNNYTKMFIFRHFFYLLILSALFTLIVGLIYVGNIAPVFPDFFSNSSFLKIILIVFVILNGILFPFLLPIIRFSKYKEYMKNKIVNMKGNFSNKENEINSRLGEMEKKSQVS